MWSSNKKIDSAMNLMLFLFGMYFLHLSQFLLPLMCLLLFIDNGFRFSFKDIKTFILLCLISLFIFIFSFKSAGFYSVMGFCIPMAYYVGSNLKDKSEESIKKIIYLIGFGMMCHVLLNFAYDFSKYGFGLFLHQKRYDVWMMAPVPSTTTSVNYTLFFGFLYYVTQKEPKKWLRLTAWITLILSLIYLVALGRRMPFLVLIIGLFISLVVDICVNKKLSLRINKRFFFAIVCILALGLGIFLYFYMTVKEFRLDVNVYIKYNPLIEKIRNSGISSGRRSILLESIKQYPNHLWGGYEISTIVGERPHDLWGDVYDTAGIIPYVLLISYSIKSMYLMIKNLISNKLSKDFYVLIIPYLSVMLLQLFEEPIYSGSSIFLLSIILINSTLEYKK